MSHPDEFTVYIEPDGRIVLEMHGVRETNYKRIIQLLEETVGPVHHVEVNPGDPPGTAIRPAREQDEAAERRQQLGRGD